MINRISRDKYLDSCIRTMRDRKLRRLAAAQPRDWTALKARVDQLANRRRSAFWYLLIGNNDKCMADSIQRVHAMVGPQSTMIDVYIAS